MKLVNRVAKPQTYAPQLPSPTTCTMMIGLKPSSKTSQKRSWGLGERAKVEVYLESQPALISINTMRVKGNYQGGENSDKRKRKC